MDVKDEIRPIGEVMSESVIQEALFSGSCKDHGPWENKGSICWGVKSGDSCPTCAAIYHEQLQAEIAEEERLRAEKRLQDDKEHKIWLIKQMNIEPAFYEASIENFVASTPELEKNVESLKRLIAKEVQQIVMIGKNGTGKTHLACAALHAMGGKIMTMYEISATIRASYTHLAQRTELELVDELASLPLLVIDEIGRTKGSDTEANWLSYIVDKRHARGLPLIIISNKHVKKTCEKGGCPDCLENYLPEDVMSRVSENGLLLRFTGDDYRKKKD